MDGIFFCPHLPSAVLSSLCLSPAILGPQQFSIALSLTVCFLGFGFYLSGSPSPLLLEERRVWALRPADTLMVCPAAFPIRVLSFPAALGLSLVCSCHRHCSQSSLPTIGKSMDQLMRTLSTTPDSQLALPWQSPGGLFSSVPSARGRLVDSTCVAEQHCTARQRPFCKPGYLILGILKGPCHGSHRRDRVNRVCGGWDIHPCHPQILQGAWNLQPMVVGSLL